MVNGSVIATAVKVKLAGNWPDYVFNKDYHLRSLDEVKNYIDQHLPELPSGQEMLKSGIDIGDMNKLLINKIKQLTLYLIEKGEASE